METLFLLEASQRHQHDPKSSYRQWEGRTAHRCAIRVQGEFRPGRGVNITEHLSTCTSTHAHTNTHRQGNPYKQLELLEQQLGASSSLGHPLLRHG